MIWRVLTCPDAPRQPVCGRVRNAAIFIVQFLDQSTFQCHGINSTVGGPGCAHTTSNQPAINRSTGRVAPWGIDAPISASNVYQSFDQIKSGVNCTSTQLNLHQDGAVQDDQHFRF